MPDVTVNGIPVLYEEEGSGPPRYLISGLGANRLSWVPMVPLLRDGFRCITFYSRGKGESEAPPDPTCSSGASEAPVPGCRRRRPQSAA